MKPYWKPFQNSPLTRFVATGVSIWDQVAPNFDRSFDNIDAFLSRGRQHGVSGLINTLWTDDVAVLIRPAFPGMAYGAVAAWQADPVKRRNILLPNTLGSCMGARRLRKWRQGWRQLNRSEIELALAVDGETSGMGRDFACILGRPTHSGASGAGRCAERALSSDPA